MSRDGVVVASLADWSTLGKPAAPQHWKPGRSAYELARDWTEDDAAPALVDLLSVRPEFAGVELVEGVVEKRTQFDGDSRGPRNHDLLLRCRLPDGSCLTVGVEGKADEPFDLPLWRYREQALRRSANTQALARLDAMVRRWFGTSLAADRGDPLLIGIGYQLFSALAGTLADAKLDGSGQAIVLIVEYVTDLTDDAQHDYNARILDGFLSRLIGPSIERSHAANGWITEPVAIRGDGTWSATSTNVSFAKLVRHRRASPSRPD